LDFRLVGAHDYGQLFEQVEVLGLGSETRAEVFRRMVFNVAAANCDDHTKNHSFLLAKSGRWALSPAYDVTHAHAPDSKWTRQHLMAVNGQTTNISADDIRAVGERFEVPGITAIVGQVRAVVARWPDFASEAGVTPESAERISKHIDAWARPLAQNPPSA
jgi:serine/threonine-protein kinase HipA